MENPSLKIHNEEYSQQDASQFFIQQLHETTNNSLQYNKFLYYDGDHSFIPTQTIEGSSPMQE